MNSYLKSGAMLCAVMAIAVSQKTKENKELPSVTMDNVEALASGESSYYYHCYGYGSLDCPDGTKADYVAIGYGL